MKKYILAMLALSSLSASIFASVNKEPIETDEAPAPLGTYSQAIRTNNTVYLSGQIGINPKTGELISEEFRPQIKQVFKNLQKVVLASGQSIDDIVKLNVYMTDLSNFQDVNAAMKLYFKPPYPARSAVEIKALPITDAVEVEAILTIPNDKQKL